MRRIEEIINEAQAALRQATDPARFSERAKTRLAARSKRAYLRAYQELQVRVLYGVSKHSATSNLHTIEAATLVWDREQAK